MALFKNFYRCASCSHEWTKAVLPLLRDDVALKVEADIHAPPVLHRHAAPHALIVLPQTAHVRVAGGLDAGFCLALGEAVGPGYRRARIGRTVRRVDGRSVTLRIGRLSKSRWGDEEGGHGRYCEVRTHGVVPFRG